MKPWMKSLFSVVAVCLMVLVTAPGAQAAIDVYEFENKAQEESFQHLTQILRCPKCQNQNLADSNAELAIDLRNKTYELLQDGHSEAEVVEFMVARYGQFVVYEPPLTPATLILWMGPFLVVLLGGVLIIRHIRRQSQEEEV